MTIHSETPSNIFVGIQSKHLYQSYISILPSSLQWNPTVYKRQQNPATLDGSKYTQYIQAKLEINRRTVADFITKNKNLAITPLRKK